MPFTRRISEDNLKLLSLSVLDTETFISCQGGNVRFCSAVWTQADLEKLPLSYRDHHVYGEAQDQPYCLCSIRAIGSCPDDKAEQNSWRRTFYNIQRRIHHSRDQQENWQIKALERGRSRKSAPPTTWRLRWLEVKEATAWKMGLYGMQDRMHKWEPSYNPRYRDCSTVPMQID